MRCKLFIYFIIFLSIGCKNASTDIPNADSSLDPQLLKLNAAIAKDSLNAELYNQRGQLYSELEKYDNAILDLNKAIHIDSLNPEYYHVLSDIYLDYYDSGSAMTTLYKVLALYPDRIPSLLKLAELKYILEDYDGAIITLNEVIKKDPQNAEAYFLLGVNFRALGDTIRAINSFQTSVEWDNKLLDAWLLLGELYENTDIKKALQSYESAIISIPQDPRPFHAKAYLLQNNGQIEEAKDIYTSLVVQFADYHDAYLNLGVLYFEQDSFDKAEELFTILSSKKPADYLPYFLLGKTQEQSGQIDKAINSYKNALNLNKNDSLVQAALHSLSINKQTN